MQSMNVQAQVCMRFAVLRNMQLKQVQLYQAG